MTTSIRYDFVDDISRKNEVLVVNTKGSCLAAGVWTAPTNLRLVDARLGCLRHVVEQFHEDYPEWKQWVVVGHRALQPDNRISRYHGIGKYLRKQGMSRPSSEFMEQVHAYEGGLRFLAAVQWETSHIEVINALMMSEQAVIILAKENQGKDIVAGIVHSGWAITSEKPPSEVLNIARREPIILIDVYGEFDDREVAVAAIGRSEILIMLGVHGDKGEI
jgi:hypothetical protein